MKNLCVVSFLTAMTFTADASHGLSRDSFVYHGGNTSENVRLSDIKEVWGTETRTVQSTCSRQEPYQVRVCRTTHGRRPHYYDESENRRDRRGRRGPRRSGGHYSGPPHHGGGHHYTSSRPPARPPRGGERCRMETRYRTVSYSCPRTESVRVRKPDQRFHANVNFRFVDKTFDSTYTRGLFDISLNQRSLRVDVRDQSSGEPLVFLAKKNQNVNSRPNFYEINADYKVIVTPKRDVISPFSEQMRIVPRLRNSMLKIRVGKIFKARPLELELRVTDRYSHESRTVVLRGRDLQFRDGRRNPNRSVIEVDPYQYFPNMDFYNGVDVSATLKIKSKFSVLNARDLAGYHLKSTDQVFVQY